MYGHPNAKKSFPRQAVAVLSVALSADSGRVQLTPDGIFRARDGRPAKLEGWKIDPVIAGRILARLRARKTPIVIDYEHQTLNTDTNGQPAPAAGWIEPLSVEYVPDQGFFAPVKWTDRAQAMIAADEYKFLSPVLPHDPNTGEVLDIWHLALTNFPGVDGMASVAALSARFDLDPEPNHEEENTVDRTQLITLLGLAADATDDQIQAGITALKTQAAQADTLTTEVAALKAAKPATPDLSQYVPKAVYEETTAQLVALKTTGETAELDRLISEGLDDGRIAGQATADYLREQGLVALKAHLNDAPSIAALKGTQTRGKTPPDDDKAGELSQAELAVCKNMGMTPDAYKAAKAV